MTESAIPGYGFGDAAIPKSPVTLDQLAQLMVTVALSDDDIRYLRLAGDVLAPQTNAVVMQWRSQIIAQIPHLARHSRSPEGAPLPDYLARSNRRFEQWILDTCRRAYDQAWLDYQQEIALRHTSRRKNQVDRVSSSAFVPFRDVIGFVAVMNDTIRPYLAANGHSSDIVERMHLAWCRSLQLQISLWAKTYADLNAGTSEW